MYNTELELYHHGVKGQKWGIRRYQNKDGSLIKSGKKHLNDFIEKRKKTKSSKQTKRKSSSKSLSEMSDEELKRKIDRMNLEIQYKTKYKELHPAKVSVGKKFIKSMGDVTTSSLEKAGKNIGSQLTTYFAGELVNKVAGKEIVNPKKGQKDK